VLQLEVEDFVLFLSFHLGVITEKDSEIRQTVVLKPFLWKHRMDIWPGIAKHKHRLLSEHYQHMICVFCEYGASSLRV